MPLALDGGLLPATLEEHDMSDNITLPRELAEEVLEALIEARALLYDGRKQDKAATALRTALAAPSPEPEPVALAHCPYTPPPSAHFGYVLGDHWLETAYSRVLDGEAEAEVLKDCGWERVTDAEALRRDAEQFRWMRENAISVDTVADPDGLVQVWVGTDPAKCFYGRTLDAAIVSAMAGSET